MKIDHDVTLTAGERLRPGLLLYAGKDGKAYPFVNHPYPWWAKGKRLRRFWAKRQPQCIGLAMNNAEPGQYVIVGISGGTSWPTY